MSINVVGPCVVERRARRRDVVTFNSILVALIFVFVVAFGYISSIDRLSVVGILTAVPPLPFSTSDAVRPLDADPEGSIVSVRCWDACEAPCACTRTV